MSCNDYIIWISGHIDGTNPKKEEQQLQAHLAGCSHCRKVLEDMKANETVMKEEVLTPPLQISRNVMASVRKGAIAKKKSRFRNYMVSAAAMAAVLCLVLVSSLRTPQQTAEDPGTRSMRMPTEEIMALAETDESHSAVFDDEVPGETSAQKTNTRSPQLDGPCHCVFVELPSRDDMPADLSGVTTEEFMSRVNREASDHYFYGGSLIYGVTEMSYEELSQWEDLIQFRFLQEFEETDRYMVVFCSESR